MKSSRSRYVMLVSMSVFLSATLLADVGEAGPASSAPERWDPETLRLFATLPIQDEGRIKPLSTYAGFTLLRLNGKRTWRNPAGEELTPLEWLLDCLFYPEIATQYRTFRVDSSEVIYAIGMTPHDRKRDWYTYAELRPGREKLLQLAEHYSHIEARDRSPIQQQILNLAINMRTFEQIVHYLDFAREPYPVDGSPELAAIFPAPADNRFSTILRRADQLRNLVTDLDSAATGTDDAARTREREALSSLLKALEAATADADALALFPPGAGTRHTEWATPADMLTLVFIGAPVTPEQLDLLASLENLAELAPRRTAFGQELARFHSSLTGLAKARGEYRRIELEVAYYRANLLYLSLMLYVVSFVLIAISWLFPRSRALKTLGLVVLLVPTLLLIAAITLRCIIRGRPPVTTLYETVLFTTAVIVVVALAAEYVSRQMIALSIGALLGVFGLFLAYKYEMKEGVDTMPSLIAVLDTNFWLATHVTTVTIGYGAGLLASAVAHVFVLGKLLGLRRNDETFYSTVSDMTYGILCFGLFFSVLGTVLGGIWANESWGRFWGWDPKENGALMIVLWELAVLHARRGDYIRHLGFAMACIVGGIIVTFSWWGINLLGVGLHSYGFTSGIQASLLVFYTIESFVLLMGSLVWLRERVRRVPAREARL